MFKYLQRFLAVLVFSASLYAADPPLNLRWTDLGRNITGKPVIVNLTDGSSVKTNVTSVEPNALAVLVTSNANRNYNKGQVSIPRGSISGLRLIAMRKRGRIIGTSAGAVVGIAAGVLVIDPNHEVIFANPSGGQKAAGFLLMAAVPVAGYFIGRHLDHTEIPITILPD